MYTPVLPSSILSLKTDKNSGSTDFKNRLFGNNTLKMGVVIEVLDTDNENNKSGQSVEYNVMAIEQQESFGINSAIYKNCIAIDSFGGIADFFQFKRRAPIDNKKVQEESTMNNQEGSVVLMLCLDGNAEKAIIIGQLPNPSRKTNLTPEKEHHGEGEFNGIRYSVDKDGAFTLTFKGATDDDGVPKDADVGGSQIKIEKDGSLEVNDAPITAEMSGGNRIDAPEGKDGKGGDDITNEKIRIDRTAMEIIMESRKDFKITTDTNFDLNTKEDTKITCKDLVMKCEGKASINSDGAFKIDAKGAFNLKATTVDVESSATTTHKTSLFTIDAPLIMLGKGGTPAVTLLTKFIGVGFAGVPVICSATGPLSSTVFIK